MNAEKLMRVHNVTMLDEDGLIIKTVCLKEKNDEMALVLIADLTKDGGTLLVGGASINQLQRMACSVIKTLSDSTGKGVTETLAEVNMNLLASGLVGGEELNPLSGLLEMLRSRKSTRE